MVFHLLLIVKLDFEVAEVVNIVEFDEAKLDIEYGDPITLSQFLSSILKE